MSFWQNVEAEREYQGISRKELAFKAEITYASISIGLERNSIPVADAALRIAKALGVSLEYLLSGDEKNRDNELFNTDEEESSNIQKLISSYLKTIIKLESLPKSTKDSIVKMIDCASQDWQGRDELTKGE